MKIALQFQRPEGRADFERARNSIRAMLADNSADECLRAILALENDFDAGVFRMKPELLGSVLCWKPDDRALSAWIYDQHCELAELARRAADIFERRVGGEDSRTMRMVGLAFLHWGEAAKWVVGRRDRYDYSWMHWLMRMAMSANRQLEQCEIRLDGRGRAASIEALFFRTLLLDRFAGGNLTRQQIEVLDAWLWEWMPALKGVTTWPDQPVFRADLDGKGGLRQGRRLDSGPTLYLPIAPLEARRQCVIKEFHRGRIVPSLGIAADFRVEEHVAVLEQLRSAFEAPQEDSAQRDARQQVAGRSIEAWLGLSEILSRGLQSDSPPAPHVGLAKKGPDSLSDTQRIRQIYFADEHESSHRFLRLADVSDTGFGFEAGEKEATGIAVGDILGLRISDDEPCVLARVVRRVPGAVEGEVVIGVRTVCSAPQAITLTRTQPQGRPEDAGVFIYVPGGDDSGAQDAFLVPEKILQEQVSHEARLGEELFELQFNRVRRKGRGWALAGFEILDARRLEDVPEARDAQAEEKAGITASSIFDPRKATPRFELVEQDDSYGHAFDREVSSRLL
ncbi:MAG: hypothetical protein ACXWGT_11200 [Usitatibacter sp.]